MSPMTIDDVVAKNEVSKVWSEIIKDSKYLNAVTEKNYTVDDLIFTTKEKMASLGEEVVDINLSSALEGASQVELWANIVIDVIMICAVCADIKLTKDKSAVDIVIKETISNPLYGRAMIEMKSVVADLNDVNIVTKSKGLLKAIQVVYTLYGPSSLKNIIEALAQHMSPWDVILSVVELVAWIALIVVSDGFALAAKIACLAVSIAALVTDIVKLGNSNNATS